MPEQIAGGPIYSSSSLFSSTSTRNREATRPACDRRQGFSRTMRPRGRCWVGRWKLWRLTPLVKERFADRQSVSDDWQDGGIADPFCKLSTAPDGVRTSLSEPAWSRGRLVRALGSGRARRSRTKWWPTTCWARGADNPAELDLKSYWDRGIIATFLEGHCVCTALASAYQRDRPRHRY
jgi:hypothetical protein